MSIKLVVFDMAGTTIEDKQNVAAALKNALHAFGFEVTIAEVNLVMGYAKPVAIRHLLENCAGKETAKDDVLVTDIHDRFVGEMIFYYEKTEGIREKDQASEVFRRLREKEVKVALDTGFSRDIANVIFTRLGWKEDKHYDISITSDEVANGRPYPDMIYKAMELAQVTSLNEVAKVGDTLSDLQEGNAAGCKYVIGITTGACTEQELMEEKHTHLVKDLRDVIDIVFEEELAVANHR